MGGWTGTWRAFSSAPRGESDDTITCIHLFDPAVDRSYRAPFTELMKTPSRTQTVKKTRAITTAMKERTDKVNRINSHLDSPLSKASPSVRFRSLACSSNCAQTQALR
jgi:hypothetical protein